MRLPSKGALDMSICLQSRVRHDLGVHGVAMLAGFVGDPGEDNGFVVFRLNRAGKGRKLAVGHVVAHAFDVFQRAVVLRHFARPAGKFLVLAHLRLRHGNDKTIDLGHDTGLR